MERLKERLATAQRALDTLQELLLLEHPSRVERDAAIQRFEYTCEAVWKAAQRYLLVVEGISAGSPKSSIRACREVGLFSEDQAVVGLEMIDDRNLTVHTYEDANVLLDFALPRGYRVEEKVIRDITKAKTAFDATRLRLRDWNDLKVAYRDLAYFLRPITIENLRAELLPKNLQNVSTWGLLLFGAAGLALLLWFLSQYLRLGGLFSLLIILALLVSWYLFIFTGIVTERKLNLIVLSCYLFCFLALLSPLIPVILAISRPDWSKEWHQNMKSSPVGILRGCVEPFSSNSGSNGAGDQEEPPRWIPKELECKRQSHQWVINIGCEVTTDTTSEKQSSDTRVHRDGF